MVVVFLSPCRISLGEIDSLIYPYEKKLNSTVLSLV